MAFCGEYFVIFLCVEKKQAHFSFEKHAFDVLHASKINQCSTWSVAIIHMRYLNATENKLPHYL